MAKYSIILPMRNGGEYVKECVASILAQTFTDFNLVVLDNCSTDGSREWIQSLDDKRIRVIPSNRPLTIEENWGRIKDIPRNEFITLIGHDDILYPDFLQKIDALVQLYPDASLFHTHFDFINGHGDIIRTGKSMPALISPDELFRRFLCNEIEMMGTGYVMRAADYDQLGGIPVNYPSLLFADFDLWIRTSMKGYMVVASENGFAFRVHQSTTGLSQDSKLHEALGIFVGFLKDISLKDEKFASLIQEHGPSFLRFYCKGYSHRLLRTSMDKRKGLTVKQFVQKTREFAKILGVADDYDPQKVLPVRLAMIIDSNPVTRRLFLVFKRLFPKPVL